MPVKRSQIQGRAMCLASCLHCRPWQGKAPVWWRVAASFLPWLPCWDLFSVAAETNSPVKLLLLFKSKAARFPVSTVAHCICMSRFFGCLHKQNSVVNFTLLFNGNLYIVPIQHKPGGDDVGTVLKDIQSAGKSIVLLWDEPTVEHWSFDKLGYVLGNHPSSVPNTDSGVLCVGSAWVLVLLSLWRVVSVQSPVIWYPTLVKDLTFGLPPPLPGGRAWQPPANPKAQWWHVEKKGVPRDLTGHSAQAWLESWSWQPLQIQASRHLCVFLCWCVCLSFMVSQDCFWAEVLLN